MEAAQGNLTRQLSRSTRFMSAENERILSRLANLGERSDAVTAKVQGTQAKTTSMYGAGLGSSIARQFNPARVSAGAGEKTVAAQAAAGRRGEVVTEGVLGIAAAGAAAQQSAAVYSLNQALQQRTIIDNQTLASLAGDMYQTALQYNMQKALADRERKYAEEQAKKAAKAETRETVRLLTEKAPGVGAWVETNIAKYTSESGIDIEAAKAAYVSEYGLDPVNNPQDAHELAVFTATLRNVQNGMGTEAALTKAIDTLYGGMAGWEKLSTSVDRSIAAEMAAEVSAINATSLINESGFDPAQAGLERDQFIVKMREQYGDEAAKNWLVENLGWSEDAAVWYISNLPMNNTYYASPLYNTFIGNPDQATQYSPYGSKTGTAQGPTTASGSSGSGQVTAGGRFGK
jgi:hypothetical protein